MGEMLLTIIGSIIAISIGVVAVVFLVVPIFKGLRWLVVHLFKFVVGMIGDLLRFVGAIITGIVFVPLILLNIIIGRWSAAAHFGRGLQSEVRAGGFALYRVFIRHPARLLLLTPLIEGIEQRVPEAVARAPGGDKPSKRTGQFDGYEIVGSLQGGGSGGRLYVAKPDAKKHAVFVRSGQRDVDQVVIKSFSLADGSTLPQMVRESRALEAARNLGLILDHELTDERFFYVMRYIPGEDLTTITKRLHAESGIEGLDGKTLHAALGHIADLLAELGVYHRGGLWHKDVKPDNIIISGGRAHLVDFGLITPLRSAMTLTTHGTEYFRDPEMVRMALRGAKVNEVDGVKFDLYGAGAVLYSLLENSFPAHGALSQIHKRCPETVRWIIRRMMADMQHRYPSASDVLADLRVVMTAPDPFSLKPIDLPSVSGQNVPPPIPEPVAEPFTVPVAAGAGALGVAAVAASPIPPVEPQPTPSVGAPPFGPQPRTRPKLIVTDWLTGRYGVAGDSPFQAGQPRGPVDDRIGRAADAFAQNVAGAATRFARSPFGRQAAAKAEEFARQAEPKVRRAAGTAAEQLARAQERVRRAQVRASARMGRRHSTGFAARREFSTRPNAGVVASVFVFLAACVGGVFLIVGKALEGNNHEPAVTLEGPGSTDTVNFEILRGRVLTKVPVQVSFHEDPADPADPDELAAGAPVAQDDSSDNHGAIVETSESVPAHRSRITPHVEPVDNPRGVILVVDSMPFDLSPERRKKLNWSIETLNKAGYRIVGLGASDDEVALVAEAKHLIGLTPADDPHTPEVLQSWVSKQEKHSVDALLWAAAEDAPLRIIARPKFDVRRTQRALEGAAE